MSDTIGFYRSLVERDPDSAPLHAHLARALMDLGDIEGALTAASEAISRDPALIEAWLVRATGYRQLGDWEKAAEDFVRANILVPDRAMILVNVGLCYAKVDRLLDAEIWLKRAVKADRYCKEALANLASVLVRLDRLVEAEAPCRAALALDPELISAHQNMSGILAGTDAAAARQHRDEAYRRQQIFIEPAVHEVYRVLVIAAADAANMPLQHLLPQSRFTLIQWYIEYAPPDQEHALPSYDLILNAIGDPDLAPSLTPAISAFLKTNEGRIFNSPARVWQTSRCRLQVLLEDIPHVIVPPVLRYEGCGSLSRALKDVGVGLPVIVRPLGTHGGKGVEKFDDDLALATLKDVPCYATSFIDFRSGDGWYRKYRVIFVDREPYPYHLAIAPSWLVHYWSAGMEHDSARRDEERAFLADPAATIGVNAWSALRKIAERLDLDYAGIDFSVISNGDVLVFEANATMLVHPERDPMFAYRNASVEAIQEAFLTMLMRRLSAPT